MHSYDTRKAKDLAEVLFDGIESTREFWCRFLLCVNIIDDLTFENQQKILHAEDYPKNEKPTEIFPAQSLKEFQQLV